MNLTTEQKEDLRHAVRAALAIRQGAALTPRKIFRVVKKELDFLFEESDLIVALEFLRGLSPAETDFATDSLGTTKYWRATSAGVLAHERA